jgi:uncharacterized protein (DUF885 family)
VNRRDACGRFIATGALLLAPAVGTRASAAAAATSAATASAQAGTPAAQLAALYDRYFESVLRLNPTAATSIGHSRYDDRFDDPADPRVVAAAHALERRCLARARALDARALTGSERISYDVFVSERERALADARFPAWQLPLEQVDNLANTFARYGSGSDAQPFMNARDYANFMQRAQGFAHWAGSAIAAMRVGAEAGVVQPRIVMQRVLAQLRAVAAAPHGKSIFQGALDVMPDAIPARERARLALRYRSVVAQTILPVYVRLADFVEHEHLPRTRASVAWSALPDGAAWYRHEVERHTTTRLTPEQIHRIGLDEVERIHAGMRAVTREIGFSGDLPAFFRYVQQDPRFYFTSADEALQAFRAMKQRVDARLPQFFADFPRADYVVKQVEAFRAASAPSASYDGPPADGSRPGRFYINTFDLKALPKFGVETLSLHEAAPGHHFQVSIQQELTSLPRFQRFNDYVAYAEGWALYCESIGREMGFFTDPMQWYGRLSDELLRAMRLVVDTGLHAKYWTREQAIAYMRENSSMAEGDTINEVERYIAWPGQALGYKIGQMKISELRARAQQALGPAFDVREFHSQVLRDGALPLDVLEAKIDRWIVAQRAGAAPAPAPAPLQRRP